MYVHVYGAWNNAQHNLSKMVIEIGRSLTYNTAYALLTKPPREYVHVLMPCYV